MFLTVASFDIGYVSFGQYVEDVDITQIKDLEARYDSLPKKEKRRTRGIISDDLQEIINDLLTIGSRVNGGVFDFTEEDNQGYDLRVRKNFLKHMEDHRWLWINCDIFVIEQQYYSAGMGRGKGSKASTGTANMNAIKLGECLYTWLLINYPNAHITYFGSQFKTQILGAPDKITKPQRKKWAVEKYSEISTLRGDQDMINIFLLSSFMKRKRVSPETVSGYLEKYPVVSKDAKQLAIRVVTEKQKLDDISDPVVQLKAYIFKEMIAVF